MRFIVFTICHTIVNKQKLPLKYGTAKKCLKIYFPLTCKFMWLCVSGWGIYIVLM